MTKFLDWYNNLFENFYKKAKSKTSNIHIQRFVYGLTIIVWLTGLIGGPTVLTVGFIYILLYGDLRIVLPLIVLIFSYIIGIAASDEDD